MSEGGAVQFSADPGLPLYDAVRDDLLAKIRDGVYPRGSRLPGRNALADHYGVAYGTVDRAIRELEEMRVVSVRNGVGSFVAERPEDRAEGATTAAVRRSHRRSPVVSLPQLDLQLQRPATLGIVSSFHPPEARAWHGVVVQSVERLFSNAGGATRVFDRWPDPEAGAVKMQDTLAQALDAEVDALLVAGVHYPLSDAEATARWLRPGCPPLVYVAWHALSPALPHVYYDNTAAGQAAAEHLLEAGYQRIVYLYIEDESWEQQRLEGVRQAVDARRLLTAGPADPEDVDRSRFTSARESASARRRAARRVMDVSFAPGSRLLKWAREGTLGIVACNDAAGRGVLDFLEDNTLEPGRRVGLVGFDDTPLAQRCGLSSVRPPLEDLAENAVRMLVQTLNGGRGPLQICCRSQVIARSSSHRPPEDL